MYVAHTNTALENIGFLLEHFLNLLVIPQFFVQTIRIIN